MTLSPSDKFRNSKLKYEVPALHNVNTLRVSDSECREVEDKVATETPIAFVYNGEPYVVMLATPKDLEDFAIGFSITEGLIANIDEIKYLDIVPCEQGIQIHIRTLNSENNISAKDSRNLAGRTGCGLCGTVSIEEVVKPIPRVESEAQITFNVLMKSLENIRSYQQINSETGSVHAAAWVNTQGEINCVREDVGRHNALDKLIGEIYKHKEYDLTKGFILVTSRASYEMVTKTAIAGIGIIAAISAPTSLAIDIANKSGVTLIGFVRDGSCVVYTHQERIEQD